MFTHDAEDALLWGAELVNTMPGSVPGDSSPDTLTTIEDLDAFFTSLPWTGRFDRDPAELEAVRDLRPNAAAAAPVLGVERGGGRDDGQRPAS